MDRYKKAIITRKINVNNRNRKIKNRVNELYKSSPNGLRYTFGSIVEVVAEEFSVSKSTIRVALKSDC